MSLNNKVTMKIKEYNVDAKKVQALNKYRLYTEMKEKYNILI